MDLDSTLPALRFKRLTLTRLLYHLIDNALNHGTGKVYIVSTMGGLFPTVSVTNPIDAKAKTYQVTLRFN